MSNLLVKPHYFTPKEDNIIQCLFDCVSTHKLSILMGVKTSSIVARNDYLITQGDNLKCLEKVKKSPN